MTDRKAMNLTEGSIFKTLFVFALPILFGNVLQTLNGSINGIWIGRYLGEAALAAASNANNILFLLIAVMFGVSIATTILVAQSVGAKNIDQAKRVIGTSATFFTAASIVVALIGFFVSPQLMIWMRTPADAVPLATAYLRIIFTGIPFLYMYSFLMMSLRGAGDSKTPFYFLIISAAIDIGLNPVLIFGLGPFPKMGIAGSATATLIAQASCLVGLIIWLYASKHFLRIQRHELRYFKLDPVILRSLIVKGTPMGLQMIVLTSSMLFMISLVNRYGSQTTAAYGACAQLWAYVQMPAVAVGQAVSAMAAQNIGAKRWDRVDRICLGGVGFNFLLSGFLISILYFFDARFLGLFLTDHATIVIAQHIDFIVVWSFALFGVTFVVSGVVRATGAVIPPLIILFFSMWVVRVPLAYFLVGKIGLNGIWFSFPFSSLIALGLSLAYYKFGSWKSAQMLQPKAPLAAEA